MHQRLAIEVGDQFLSYGEASLQKTARFPRRMPT
jgi:hypothetical protein